MKPRRPSLTTKERHKREAARHRAKVARALPIGARLSENFGRWPKVCAGFMPDRHERCESYSLCLDDAVIAQGIGRLGEGCSWRCAENCPGRAS